MQTTILTLILFAALALFGWAEWRAPGKALTLKALLLKITILALVGLLGLWGLPIATDVFTAITGT